MSYKYYNNIKKPKNVVRTTLFIRGQKTAVQQLACLLWPGVEEVNLEGLDPGLWLTLEPTHQCTTQLLRRLGNDENIDLLK